MWNQPNISFTGAFNIYLASFFPVLQTSDFISLIVEFDVDEELPDDEEIERRFATLLVSWIQIMFKIVQGPELDGYIYATHDK